MFSNPKTKLRSIWHKILGGLHPIKKSIISFAGSIAILALMYFIADYVPGILESKFNMTITWAAFNSYPDLDFFRNVIIGGMSLSGVFLALFCANNVAVFSARYTKSSDLVFQMYISNFNVQMGIQLVLGYIIFCITLLGCMFLSINVSGLTVDLFILMTVGVVCVFGIMWNLSLQYTDAFKLLENHYKILRDEIQNVGDKCQKKEKIDMAASRQLVMDEIRKIYSVEKDAIEGNLFDKHSMMTFLNVNLGILWNYWNVKKSIPFDSKWYPNSIGFQKWYDADYLSKNIYLSSGTTELMKRESINSEFLESNIFKINLLGLKELKGKEDYLYVINYLQHYNQYSLQIVRSEEAMLLLNNITEIMKVFLQPERQSDWGENAISGIVDSICGVLISIILGQYYKAQSFSKTKLDKESEIAANAKSFDDIDFSKNAFLNNSYFKNIYGCVETERELERRTLTPTWFIKQEYARMACEELLKSFEVCEKVGEKIYDLTSKLSSSQFYWGACTAIGSYNSYLVKCQLLQNEVEEALNLLELYHLDKSHYKWKCYDKEAITDFFNKNQTAICGLRVDILSRIMAKNSPKGTFIFPDLVGALYEDLLRDLMTAIYEDDSKRFVLSYQKLYVITMNYSDRISNELIRRNADPIEIFQKASSPFIQFMKISGLAYLLGKIKNQESWHDILRELPNNLDKEQVNSSLEKFINTYKTWNESHIITADPMNVDYEIKFREYYGKDILTALDSASSNDWLKRFCHHSGEFLDFNYPPEELYILFVLNPFMKDDKKYYGAYNWGEEYDER